MRYFLDHHKYPSFLPSFFLISSQQFVNFSQIMSLGLARLASLTLRTSTSPIFLNKPLTMSTAAAAAAAHEPETLKAAETVMSMLHEAKDRGYIGENVSQQEVSFLILVFLTILDFLTIFLLFVACTSGRLLRSTGRP
jgi:hypothetical protein